jgi:hypothetical protein
MNSACPICKPLLDEIARANDFLALMEFRRCHIPGVQGITDDQRAGLHAAVVVREEILIHATQDSSPSPACT